MSGISLVNAGTEADCVVPAVLNAANQIECTSSESFETPGATPAALEVSLNAQQFTPAREGAVYQYRPGLLYTSAAADE